MRNRASHRIVRVALGLIASAVVAVGGLTACGEAVSKNARTADQRAQIAANAMRYSPDPIPTTWAAWQVVGAKVDTTIEALRATGTIHQGSIVLRITVAAGGEFDSPSVRCYEYDYSNRDDGTKPRHLGHCPSGPALVLSGPPAQADLGRDGAEKLRAIIAGLSAAQRRDDAVVTTAVTAAFPPPETVVVSKSSATETYIGISTFGPSLDGVSCIHATVPLVGDPTIVSAHGTDCRGG